MRAGGPRPDHPADPRDDEPRHHRGVLRQPGDPRRQPDRRGGQGLPLHPRRHERRAHPDRGGMHRRRRLVHREGAAYASERGSSAARSARTRASSSRSPRLPQMRAARSLVYDAAALYDAGEPAASRPTSPSCWPPRLLGGRRHLPADPWRLRLRRGIRRRAQVPRDAPLQVAPISTNLILAYVAEHVLGMPRSY